MKANHYLLLIISLISSSNTLAVLGVPSKDTLCNQLKEKTLVPYEKAYESCSNEISEASCKDRECFQSILNKYRPKMSEFDQVISSGTNPSVCVDLFKEYSYIRGNNEGAIQSLINQKLKAANRLQNT